MERELYLSSAPLVLRCSQSWWWWWLLATVNCTLVLSSEDLWSWVQRGPESLNQLSLLVLYHFLVWVWPRPNLSVVYPKAVSCSSATIQWLNSHSCWKTWVLPWLKTRILQPQLSGWIPLVEKPRCFSWLRGLLRRTSTRLMVSLSWSSTTFAHLQMLVSNHRGGWELSRRLLWVHHRFPKCLALHFLSVIVWRWSCPILMKVVDTISGNNYNRVILDMLCRSLFFKKKFLYSWANLWNTDKYMYSP